MTFKEKIDCLRFAFALCNKFDKSIYPIAVLKWLCNAILPLIPTFFSAKIVDELTGSKDIKTLILYGITMAVLIAVFEFARHLTDRAMDDKTELLHIYEGKVFEESIVNKDYELLEDVDFQTAVKAYKVVYQNNYGIFANMWFLFGNFITGILSLMFSLILVGPLIIKCFEIDNSSFLTSYKPLVILAVSVVFIGFFMILIGNKYSKIMNGLTLKFNTLFGIFSYWYNFPLKYQNGKEIRIYNAQETVLKKRNESLNDLYMWDKKSFDSQAKFTSILMVFQMIIMGMFYLFVAIKAYAGMFGIGSFVLFLGASLQIAEGINLIGQISSILGMSTEHISYLKRIVETPQRKHIGTLPVEKRNDNRYDIEFKNVSFKYPGTDEYILKNFNAKLEIGQHMAVVGKNGSGKTTFIKLLCRLYDVTDGEITLNGINIKKYDLNEYMSLFSVVFQDFQLFSVPLSQNVTTSLEYDKEKLYDCLDKAGVKERVEQMTDKENSIIYKDFDDNGIEISGGEAQKLALARALYKDAPFVILDEPTSALDPISEFEIYQRFNSFVGDKTAIYISHRLSSCRFCNHILVFDDGRIVQQGSHDELVQNTEGKYYQLWSAQSQYYV
ncbi:MAG: ABC transporter ATP-binding protein/permease [Eubacterium sp.]|nr:ABC transporter ATP-binding protein/permease [Eubacterium sp.]